MKKVLLSLWAVLQIGLIVQAQTIFTYGENKVEKDEFVRMYTSKNANSPNYLSQKSIEEYIDLYAIFKMKVADAYANKIDATPAFITEYRQFKTSLAKTYIIDESLSEMLLREAYERSKTEVEIAHIQISIRGKDTLSAYNKANEIFEGITKGLYSFESAAEKFSEDGGTKLNGGEVGYITVFDVLYPLESAAYNTQSGQFSKPVRSAYGYHIVKVLNKRPSQGSVQVAQILVQAQRSDEASVKLAKNKADDYYQRLKKGEDFDQMVKEYSEDKFSKNNKGILDPFTAGKMDPNFEKVAFNLKKVGDISEPVQTDYGFHILKLIKKSEVGSFESAREALMAQLKNDDRLNIAEEAAQQRDLERLHYREHPENLNMLIQAVEKDTIGGRQPIQIKDYESFTATLFEINKQKFTQFDYIAYVIEATGGNIYGRRDKTLRDLYFIFHQKTIEDVQAVDLEANNPEYRHSLQEYRESYMMFAMMEKEIWSKALNDNRELYQYYEANKNRYLFQAGFGGSIFESSSKTTLEQLAVLLNSGMDAEEAIETVNKENAGKAQRQSGKYEYASVPAKVTGLEVNKVSQVFQAENGNYFIVLPDILFEDNTQKTFEEARAMAISDYQKHLETVWEQRLRSTYPLKINEKEVKKMVKR